MSCTRFSTPTANGIVCRLRYRRHRLVPGQRVPRCGEAGIRPGTQCSAKAACWLSDPVGVFPLCAMHAKQYK